MEPGLDNGRAQAQFFASFPDKSFWKTHLGPRNQKKSLEKNGEE